MKTFSQPDVQNGSQSEHHIRGRTELLPDELNGIYSMLNKIEIFHQNNKQSSELIQIRDKLMRAKSPEIDLLEARVLIGQSIVEIHNFDEKNKKQTNPILGHVINGAVRGLVDSLFDLFKSQ